MPIITAPAVTPEQPPAPPPIDLPEVGYASVTYVDPTGQRWPMTDLSANWYTLAEGVSGLGAAPYKLTSDQHPRGGERLRHVQAQARTIVWPILVRGENHTEFIKHWRDLAVAFTRTLREGPGWLEIARPDGTARRIAVYYRDGWEGRGRAATGITWDSTVTTLWCEDPYYLDVRPVGVHRESGAQVDFQDPFPSVSSSQVLGATTVENPGNIEVWPSWRISGPATVITFSVTKQVRDPYGVVQRVTESFTLDMAATPHGPLLAGETATVSTDPPAARADNGDDLVGGLDWPTAELWSLPPGRADVTFELAGAAVGSAVDLEFYPRYETA
ncbi:phage tail protein [Streptomyces rochei]|uniref:phage tail protein n=1 Tax=Streptomyces rochei TaxID=1928 RepID=UPI00344A9A4D